MSKFFKMAVVQLLSKSSLLPLLKKLNSPGACNNKTFISSKAVTVDYVKFSTF